MWGNSVQPRYGHCSRVVVPGQPRLMAWDVELDGSVGGGASGSRKQAGAGGAVAAESEPRLPPLFSSTSPLLLRCRQRWLVLTSYLENTRRVFDMARPVAD
jgi:hypothetical protein